MQPAEFTYDESTREDILAFLPLIPAECNRANSLMTNQHGAQARRPRRAVGFHPPPVSAAAVPCRLARAKGGEGKTAFFRANGKGPAGGTGPSANADSYGDSGDTSGMSVLLRSLLRILFG